MRRFRLSAAVLFLLLSLQVIVPAQLWHELSDHDDTHECDHPSALISVSAQHTHCLVLELTLPGMLNEEHGFAFSTNEIQYCYSPALVPSVVFIPVDRFEARGPPAAFFYC